MEEQKQWVESFGHMFAGLPDGKWVCADTQGGPDGFSVTCDTLDECVEEAADWLEDSIDPDMPGIPPRPASRSSVPGTGVAQ